MEHKPDKQALATRLAICVVAALILYYGGEKICKMLKLSLWEQFRPWLEKNKIQAVATVAAVLFGISLAIFPLESKKPLPEGDGCDLGPDDGYTPCTPGCDGL